MKTEKQIKEAIEGLKKDMKCHYFGSKDQYLKGAIWALVRQVMD